MNDNRMRQAPSAATAPAYQGGRPQHFQQEGLINTPLQLQQQFYIEIVSKLDGQTYSGQFTVRKLAIKDIAQIGVRKTQLNGGFHHDEDNPGTGIAVETDWINQMLAYMEIAVVQAPMWFNLNTIYDADILVSVFRKATEFENNFFRPIRDQNGSPGSRQDDSSRESEKSGTVGLVAPVVGGEVSAALEP